MSVILSDIKFRAAATTPEADGTTQIGGAIDGTKKYDFSDFTGTYQIISSNAGDTTQTITLSYRDVTGAIQSEVKTLNGTTVVTSATSIERIMKAVKSATCAGDVALESQTAVKTGTAQGAGNGVNQIQLDAGASAVDGFYTGMVLRLTGGTGSGQIAQIIDYVGSTKLATISRTWGTQPDGTSVFRVSNGIYFDKTPTEVTYVVRMDYDAVANPAGGGAVDYYIKGFFHHSNASGSGLTLTSCSVSEGADPVGVVTFALATAINDSGTNGPGNNRKVAPAGLTFDNALKNVPSGATLAAGDKIGVWIKMSLADGQAAIKSTWTPRFQGVTP